MKLKGKHILLGITGSIAAYKAASLARLLIKEGAEVQAIMTPSAKEFITPLTLSTLTQKPVVSEFFDRRDGSWHSHVSLGLWTDLFVVAPATAATIAKMATGIADNMLTTSYLSMKAPTWIAPAMDLDMYAHPSTQQNIEILRKRRHKIIEASSGFLASGLEGKGRMQDPEIIRDLICQYFTTQQAESVFYGKKILITAGPTHEAIDPVRFIGNHSSGKMGLEIAREALTLGAKVEIILGPTLLPPPDEAIVTHITSAEEMLRATEKKFDAADIVIFAAAVADYRPKAYHQDKVKREVSGETLNLSLIRNPDIAATLCKRKRTNQLVVGFALETSAGIDEATRKMEEKNFDIIVLNSLQDKGAGFGLETNKITILSRNQQAKQFPLKEKSAVAKDIMKEVASYLDTK